MARVYELELPGNLQPGSRAAQYVSRYSANRSRMWELAMEEAKRRLAVDEADFEQRVALADATRDALLEQIANTEKLLADLQTGAIDREVARNRRNIDRVNAERRFDADAANRAARATAPTTTTTTTAPGEEESPYPTPRQFERGFQRIQGEAGLESARRATSAVQFSATSGQEELRTQTQAALAKLEAELGRATGTRLNPAQRDLLRGLVREDVNSRFNAARPDITLDDARALQIATDPTTATEFETIRSIAGGEGGDGAGSVRVSTTQRETAPVVGYETAFEGAVDTAQSEADLEARLAELRQNLEALEVPEQQVRSLVDTARDEYRRLFGVDRLRPRRTTAPDYGRLLRAIEQQGAEAIIERAKPAPPPQPIPEAFPAISPPPPPLSRETEDLSARLGARMRGATLARDGVEDDTNLGRVVNSLYASRGAAPLADLENEIIRSYDGDEQRRGLELLHSLAVLDVESTMADV